MPKLINVKVFPRSQTTSVAGDPAGYDFVVRVSSAPEDGRANKEVVRLLARHLGITQHALCLISGHASRAKRFEVRR